MPRVKIKRKSTTTDMTAMCDVAFLLLTFFILTAKPRQQDPVPVDTPASTVTIKQPEKDIATLVVGSGKVFFDITGANIRIQTLEQMGQRYGVTFTQEEKNKYANLQAVGVPMNQMKQFLSMEPEQREKYTQPGIPADTTNNNELFHWIREARIADKVLDNAEMRISIKGNAKEEYPTIKKVITILQKQKVNKFNLITSLRSAK
ncbi:biopolymer transporter ExbD [Mucilaginibacter sp. RS28]|uniref:Biopolymer transporter ExbD n=1 Tax=Mucilaginibacter straminoryzae TaxID=2932774 RepID=A0A9X2BAG2_9SPHI|nr:biopolymer transporter ExbD [Mucilaginibacter straminoryzae]MCJ8210780.1 biopolymer transporter ExbD [Mucilaginibacter straminoryzae]